MPKHTFTYQLLLSMLLISPACGILKKADTLTQSDIVARLTTLRQFVPQKHYTWHIRWIHRGIQQYSTLEGSQKYNTLGELQHWINIKFSSDKSLIFNKSNPDIALYPNKLCLCPQESFNVPLANLPGLCIHMIAMPFLGWDIVDHSQCAKLGRRTIRVLLANDNLRCEIFLDKNFNTILQAKMWDTQQPFNTSFTLKRLKKFKGGWGIQTAEFTLNGNKTLLYVDVIEAKD